MRKYLLLALCLALIGSSVTAQTVTTYRGMSVLSPDPTGAAGLAWQNNFKELADRLGNHIEAADDPTASDDSAGTGGEEAVMTLSTWRNTGDNGLWICVDPTATAAVWYEVATSSNSIVNLAKTDGNFIVGDGSAWVAESGATARTSLGVGTANNVQFATLGIGGVPVAGSPLVIYQTGDTVGWQVNGFDDQAAKYLRGFVSAAGVSAIYSSNDLLLSALSGNVTHSATGFIYQNAGSYVRFQGETEIEFDSGGLYVFRDKDGSYATRLAIDSAATPATGTLVIPSDGTNSIVLGADSNVSLGCIGAAGLQISVAGGGVGIGGVPTGAYPITAYQSADAKGILVYGYDDKITSSFQIYINSAGDSNLLVSGASTWQSGTNLSLVTGTAGHTYLNTGGYWYFGDKDAANATRVQIDSAATASVARIRVPEDSLTAYACGAGDDLKIGFDGTNAYIVAAPGAYVRLGINHFVLEVGSGIYWRNGAAFGGAILHSGASTNNISFYTKSNGGAPRMYIEDSTGALILNHDTYWVGDDSGVPYGHMYTNTTITVAISDNNPTEVQTAGTDFTTGQLNLVTFSDHYLQVTKAGRYFITYSISCGQNSPSAAINLEAGIMVNGTAAAGGKIHRVLPNAADIGAMGSPVVLDLAANDQISLYVTNETNTTDIDVAHANVVVSMVGGT